VISVPDCLGSLAPGTLAGLPATLRRRPEIQALSYAALAGQGALGDLPAETAAAWRAEYLTTLAANLPRLFALQELLGAARTRGLRLVPIKGGILAMTHYPDPGARPMQDLDVVCLPEELDAAVDLCAGLGYVVLPHEGFRLREGATHDVRVERGPVVVELHFRLWHEVRLGSEVRGLIERATEASLPSGRVLAPAAADHLHFVLVHAALHAFCGNPVWLFDAALLAERAGPGVWGEVHARARELRTALPLAYACDQLELVLPGLAKPPPSVRAALRRALLRRAGPWLWRGEPELGLLPSRLVKPLLFEDAGRLLGWSAEKARIWVAQHLRSSR
jgi:hypothetical protein